MGAYAGMLDMMFRMLEPYESLLVDVPRLRRHALQAKDFEAKLQETRSELTSRLTQLDSARQEDSRRLPAALAALEDSKKRLAAETDRATKLEAERAQVDREAGARIAAIEAKLAGALRDVRVKTDALEQARERVRDIEARCRDLQLACDSYRTRLQELREARPGSWAAE
jgi:chromosome segregation ATPase